MTRTLKALKIALLAVCALGAVAMEAASAAPHEFHAAKERVITKGTNENEHIFAINVGETTCNKVTTESTQIGTFVSADTYKTDEVTVKPHYSECTFGGQPATVNFNHCAYLLDSDTTTGNAHAPRGQEHANLTIECANPGERIEDHTAACTITIAPQVVEHAVRYHNIQGAKKEITIETTAAGIEVTKTRTTASQPVNGCLLFPTGAVGTTTGNFVNKCFEDLGQDLGNTDKQTPTGLTTAGNQVDCTVTDT